MTSADATSGADADEAAAAAIDPAAPLRGPAFEGADDASLGDDEWLARAIAAAAEAGLVGDAGAVAERLGEVGLEPRAARECQTRALSPRDETARRADGLETAGSQETKRQETTACVPRAPRGWSVGVTDACLLVDNYDSYTYNLYHLVAAVDGKPPVVVTNDEVVWGELRAHFADRRFSRCVLSPGPGNPGNAKDVGVCRDIVDRAVATPVLGVCLGHQLLAHAHGVKVTRARVPTHGRVSVVRHDERSELFDGIPRAFEQTRYHSLVVDPKSLETNGAGALRATAWTEASAADAADDDDGLFVNRWVTAGDIASERAGGAIMALEHVSRPHFGVQFHPESVCSEPHGARVYANFAAVAARHWRTREEREPETRDASPSADRVAFATETDDERMWEDGFDTRDSTRTTTRRDEPEQKTERVRRPTKLLWTRLPRALAETPGGAETLFWSVVAPGADAFADDGFRDAREGFGESDTKRNREKHARFLPTEATRDTFWLDSATADETSAGEKKGCARSRFSFMGGAGGTLWRRAVYRLPRSERDFESSEARARRGPRVGAPPPFRGGRLEVTDSEGERSVREGVAVTAYLEEELDLRRCGARERVASWAESAKRRAFASREEEDDENIDEKRSDARLSSERYNEASDDSKAAEEAENLPFEFQGGFVGYLGYETRAECGAQFLPGNDASTPDAAFFFADRFLVADHATGDVFVAALVDDVRAELRPYARKVTENENRNGLASAAAAAAEGVVRVAAEDAEAAARAWMAETERAVLGCAAGHAGSGHRADAERSEDSSVGVASRLASAPRLAAAAAARAAAMACEPEPAAGDAAAARFAPRKARDAYVRAIRASQDRIDAGETYEVCLTNQLVRGGETATATATATATEKPEPEKKNDAFASLAPDPATLYSALRATNPAPYAAYLCFGGCEVSCSEGEQAARTEPSLPGARVFDDGDVDGDGDDDEARRSKTASSMKEKKTSRYAADDVLAVCCCSPERFLRLSEGTSDDARERGGDTPSKSLVLEAKPIKGTAPRRAPPGGAADVAEAEALARRVKDRAENLMIVDLLRNDLGRVCEPGSVAVPGLMKIESYATVHQLVSTVRGTPRASARRADASAGDDAGDAARRTRGVSSVACVAAAFPPGSMTGAPKARTCEIIDGLEDAPRGVYSGAIGFFSAAGDAFDLNVCIRTCVVRPATDEAWIGCGGAITALSDADEEWEETRLKARAVLRAVRAVDEAADADRARREARRAEGAET